MGRHYFLGVGKSHLGGGTLPLSTVTESQKYDFVLFIVIQKSFKDIHFSTAFNQQIIDMVFLFGLRFYLLINVRGWFLATKNLPIG